MDVLYIGSLMNKKPYNSGTWTDARFRGFIKSALRAASMRWGPRNECKKRAKVGYGKYRCDNCGTVGPATLPPPKGKKKRINNAIVDHINPVVPTTGWTSWDDIIQRMFCEVDGFQLLCHKCHTEKTEQERNERRES